VVALVAGTLVEPRSPSEFCRPEKRGLAWGFVLVRRTVHPRGLGLADIHSRATPHDVTRTADPLLAFPSPAGSDSPDSPRASRRTAPLLGFGPLQRFRGAESTSLLSAGPNRPTTFRPQGSRPLDGLLLHPPCPRLSARASLLGFSLQGFPLSNRPLSSSLTGPLLAFLPRSGRSPSRTERTGGAWRSPRSPLRLLSPTGCCSVRESVPYELPVKVARRPIPSWSSAS